MIEKEDAALLADFAKLVARYGIDRVQKLASLSANGELAQMISSSASVAAFADKARLKKTGHNKTPQVSLSEELSSVRKADPERYQALIRFFEPAGEGRILQIRADLLQLTKGFGVRPPEKSTREQLLVRILEELKRLPAQEIDRRIRRILERTKGEHSLEGWSDIIFSKSEA